MKARVLIVAREDALAGPLSDGLGRLDWRCVTARGPEAALAAMEDFAIEAVIIDVDSTGATALTLPPILKAASASSRATISTRAFTAPPSFRASPLAPLPQP